MMQKTLRIFISSPGDVGQERLIATRVIERLQSEFALFFRLEPILWEHEPLRATAHFQEQIVPPSQTDITVCILWSRLGTRLPENFRREDGTSFSSGTEWEFEDAARAYREKGVPDLLVYRKTSEAFAALGDEDALMQRLAQKRALDAFIERWFGSAQNSFKAAFHSFKTPDEFEDTLETHLRALLHERMPQHASAGEDASTRITWHQGSPFRGLEAFESQHAAIFFGRTRAIGEIKDALAQQAADGAAFVLVLGASGCGKSSLVRAGVLPTLAQPGVVEGIGLWRTSTLRPGDGSPLLDALAQAIAVALPELASGGVSTSELATMLRETPQHALAPLKLGLARASEIVAAQEKLDKNPDTRLLLGLDQMEEIFTIERVSEPERRAFVAALSTLARSGLVWIVATMRSDFYPRCAELPDLIALKEGTGQYDLLPPSFAEIEQIIVQPARSAGLSYEFRARSGEKLSDVLHEAAAHDPEALPLLEFTLDELFKARDENGVLTFTAYERLGGLEGALARRAEDVFQALDEAAQSSLPEVLRALVTIRHGRAGGASTPAAGESEAPTGKRALLREIASSPARKTLIDAFVGARLLVTDRTDDGEAIVGLAHEALLKHWPRVQQWLAADREFLQTRERVATAEAHWQQEKQRADFLLPPGKPLAEAEDLLQRRQTDLDASLIEYIQLSSGRERKLQRRRVGVFGAAVVALTLAAIITYSQLAARRENYFEKQKIAYQKAYDQAALAVNIPGLEDREQALQHYEKCFAIAQELARDWKSAPDDWNARAVESGEGVVKMHLARGDLEGGVKTAAIVREFRSKLPPEKLPKGKTALSDYARTVLQLHIELAMADSHLLNLLSHNKALHAALRRRMLKQKTPGTNKEPRDPMVRALERLRMALAMGEFAAKEANRIGDRQLLALIHMELGDLLKEAGQNAEAETHYKKCQEIREQLALAHKGEKTGDLSSLPEKVAQVMSTAIENADTAAPHDLYAIQARLGDLSLAQNDPNAALAAYRKALQILLAIAPGKRSATTRSFLSDAHYKIANALLKLGDIKGAHLAVGQAVALANAMQENSFDGARLRLARAYYQEGTNWRVTRDLPRAILALQKSEALFDQLARTTKDPEIRGELDNNYGNLSWQYILLRRFPAATAAANKGLKLDPSQHWIKVNLAHGYLLSNQFDKAKAIYLANKNRRLTRLTFGQTAVDDFDELQTAGISHPRMAEIEKLLRP
jgi:tetratricopeptide (TPR) repeat protein